MIISREFFDEQRLPRFGKTNPERMTFAFWEWMIRDDEPREDAGRGLEKIGLRLRNGKLKSSYGPYRARDLFNIPLNREEGPIWTFDRMGQTRTRLPDGRLICIGGEHEDFYDPDFFIYNDVVVFTPEDGIEIYAYPKEVFPPTDFHSATVADGQIVIIGGVGYKNERRPGHTPVYSLDLSSYCISQILTSGEMPGWISEHEASCQEGTITIRAGQRAQERDSRQRFSRNFEDYALDLKSCVWRRLTDRNWHEFSIRQEKGELFVLERNPKPEALIPRNIPHVILPREGNADVRFLVEEVPVSLTINVRHIAVVVEGNLHQSLLGRLVEEIRANTEAQVNNRCTVDHVE